MITLIYNFNSHLQNDLDGQLQQAAGKLVVLDFFATWCGPCKMISPKLAELATQYADNVVVLKVGSESQGFKQ